MKPTSLSEKAESAIKKALDTWVKDNLENEKLDKYINVKLNEAKDKIVMKLLGFDDRWSKGWEIDHCNGRSGNSAAGERLRARIGKKLDEWLNQVDLPEKIPQELMRNLKAEYETELRRSLSNEIIRRAEDRAKELAEQIMNEQIDGGKEIDLDDLENYK